MKKAITNLFLFFAIIGLIFPIQCEAKITVDEKKLDDISSVVLNVNQEYTITMGKSNTCSINYKSPLRPSDAKIMIYDVITTYRLLSDKSDTYYTDIKANNLSITIGHFWNKKEYLIGSGKTSTSINYFLYDDGDEDFDIYCSSYADLPEGEALIDSVSFKIKILSEDSNPYKKIPATEISIPSKKTITKGFSAKLKVTYDSKSETLGKLTWKSSNKKIATVDSSGNVKAKKVGKCKITCTLKNGKRYTCQITVKDNIYNGTKFSKCNVYDYRYGQVALELVKAYYKGNTLVVQCAALNNRIFKAVKFTKIKLTVKLDEKNISKTFKNVTLNIGPRGKKLITFKFPNQKKKYDLRQDVFIDYDYTYIYSY